MSDLIAFIHQQLENQRFRADGLRTLAHVLPADTGAYLIETADLLLAEVDAKRAILDRYEFVTGHGPARDNIRAMDMTTGAGVRCSTSSSCSPSRTPGRDGWREEWRT